MGISIIFTLLSIQIESPITLQQDSIEKGFPFPWFTQYDVPGNDIPIIGWIVGIAETTTTIIQWEFFIIDFIIIFAVLTAITSLTQINKINKVDKNN